MCGFSQTNRMISIFITSTGMSFSRSNKEALLWLKRIKWKDMTQENLIEEADSCFGAIQTKRHPTVQAKHVEFVHKEVKLRSAIYVPISTHLWFFPHGCGKIHILQRDQLCGFNHRCVFYCTYVWKKPNMCGKTHTGRCWVFSTQVW